MNKPIMLLFFISIFILTFVSSSGYDYDNGFLGYAEKGDCFIVKQSCASCSYTNISSINYPNSSRATTSVPMLLFGGGEWSYEFCNTNETGRYDILGHGDLNGDDTQFKSWFLVTENGNPLPSAGVVVLFVIAFIIIISGLIALLLSNVLHIIQWDLDGADLIYNISLYIATFATYILGQEYLGNAFVNEILLWVLSVAAISNVLLPLIGFVMSFIKGGLDKNGR